MPLVHGFWQQRTLAVLGRMLTLSVIARRSRHFAGTRYPADSPPSKQWGKLSLLLWSLKGRAIFAVVLEGSCRHSCGQV